MGVERFYDSVVVCSIENCDRVAEPKGFFCSAHYRMSHLYGTYEPLQQCVGCLDFFRWRLPKKKHEKMMALCDGCKENVFSRWSKSNIAKHGVSPYFIARMLIDQNNVCGICGNLGKLVIDHNHSCCPKDSSCINCIRGLLCGPCNIHVGCYERGFMQRIKNLDSEHLGKIKEYIYYDGVIKVKLAPSVKNMGFALTSRSGYFIEKSFAATKIPAGTLGMKE